MRRLMLSEFRLALRRLSRAPLFSATALASLALCVAANLTIFAVVDAVLVRSLPFEHPERLVNLYYVYPRLPSAIPGASVTNYYERRGKIPALSSTAEIDENTTVLGESGATSIEKLGRVTPEFFSTLGVSPMMGRAFSDADMTYQTDHVAILSYDYWKSQFAADPGVIGKHLRMDGDEKTIVGVLPPKFRFLSFQAPVYMPLSTEEAERNVNSRHSNGKIEIGRIADGATLAQVQAQIDAQDAVLAPEFPESKIVAEAGTHTVVAPLQADYVASVRPTLVLLQTGALFLLVIGCVNLVNLLLVRASNRSREMAIRRALGAGRRQIIGEVMAETMTLALAGSLLGLWLGDAGVTALAHLGVDKLPLGGEVVFNARLAMAALCGAVVVGALVAIPIAWFSLQGGLSGALKSEGRGGTATSSALRVRRFFIVAQVALAFVLLVGSCLLGLSLRRVMAVSPGFRADHVITGEFNLTWRNYPGLGTFHNFFDRLSEKTAGLPGMTAIGATAGLPMSGKADGDVMTVKGYVAPRGESGIVVHDDIAVAGDYFQAMGIPLLSGRYLEPRDAAGDKLYCVVDETFARHYWPDGNALGHEVCKGSGTLLQGDYFTIVGVVGSVKQTSLAEEQGRGAFYEPFSRKYARKYVLVARTSLAPEAVANSLVRAVRESDPDVPLTNLHSMEANISSSLSTRKTPALMAAFFASAALLLAMFGLYGVMSYAVAQRTREFGIRLALGAQGGDVLRLVFLEGVRLALIGLLSGIALSLVLTRFMASLLYGVRSYDPMAYGGVTLVIALVVAVACLLPAYRATTVDPTVALRSE
jgi:predicted permease